MNLNIEEIRKIISENKSRNAEIDAPYDPVIGTGSPIPRFQFNIDSIGEHYLMLPRTMLDIDIVRLIRRTGSIETFVLKYIPGCRNYGDAISDFVGNINKLRLEHDFEFWAATCAKIKPKAGGEIPFILNRPQRRLLKKLEKLRLSGIPIRIILLKARQWGGSTLVQLYMAWIQLFVKKGWNSAIITHVENQARHIRGMFNTVRKNHPKDVLNFSFKPYEGSSKNKYIPERDCIMGIGSYEKPDNLRSFTFQMLHISEIGLWTETLGKKPEDLTQSLRSTIPQLPLTMVVLESTAKGVGNFFHREWHEAMKGRGYDPVFVPCYEIEEYRKPIKNLVEFINSMDALDSDGYAWEMWRLGATLESINWYFNFKNTEGYDKWRMQSEFPNTAEEAFQSTGHRVFPLPYVLKVRKNNTPPVFVGEIFADSTTGAGALKNIQFQPVNKGNLWIWAKPDTTQSVSDRYAVFVDIGGRSAGADNSVIRVIDRLPLMKGLPAEMVLT